MQSGPPERMRAFLMTDIVGSTLLTQEHPVAYHAVLMRHNELAEETFARAGGRLLKARGQGDGLLGEFESPSSAVEAAHLFSDALQELFIEGKPLGVRFALHFGTCYGTGDDYFGHTLNLCARLRDIGHASQFLCTEAIASFTPEVDFLDHGWHSLRDIAEPVHIFQVGHHPYPKLKTEERFRMPSFSTEFIGRAAEVARVIELLESKRVVALVGPGGMGKTRLASESALRSGLPAAFANLIEAVDEPTIERVICSAFGESSVDSLAKVFASPTLIVADNCEHVSEAARAVIDRLTARYPQVKVITTSRVRIPFQHSTSFSLEGMREGRDLFLSLAAADDAAFELRADEEADLAELCDAAAGIPLVLEMAASQVHSLGLSQIRERLSILIHEGPASLPGRHRSIDAVLGASFERLPAKALEAASLWAWCAGGLTLDLAERLAGDEAAKLANELVAHSLLRFDRTAQPVPRYRFLEVVRTYLLEMNPGSSTPPPAGYAFASETAAIIAQDPGNTASLANAEMPNFRVLLQALDQTGDHEGIGLRIATDLGRHWALYGVIEGASWLRRMLAHHPLPPESFDESIVRANAWNRLGVCLYKQGEFSEALRSYEEAHFYANRADNRALAISVRLNQGLVLLAQGRHEDARPSLTEAEVFFRLEGMEHHWLLTTNNLGRVELETGHWDQALHHFTVAEEAAKRLSDESTRSQCLLNLAEVHLCRREPALALPFLSQVEDSVNQLDSLGHAMFYLLKAIESSLSGETLEAAKWQALCREALTNSGGKLGAFERSLQAEHLSP